MRSYWFALILILAPQAAAQSITGGAKSPVKEFILHIYFVHDDLA